MSRRIAVLVALLAAAASRPALAAGESVDIELIRPTWSDRYLPGVDTPWFAEANTVRGGVSVQYTKDPLLLYTRGSELGSVVANRLTFTGGVSWDIGDRIGVRASVPFAAQWGTDYAPFTREGAVFGDILVGLRGQVFSTDRVAVGLHGDVGVPSGSREAWIGEAGFRGLIGTSVGIDLDRFEVVTDLTVTARDPVPTQVGLLLGSELTLGVGGRYYLVPDRTALGATFLQRAGFERFLQPGAETPSELITTLDLHPTRRLQWQLGAGKGIAQGYGTSAFRAFTTLTLIRPPKADEPPPPLDLTRIPPPPEQVEVEPIIPEEPVWEEEELARIEGERIVIRDPIEFEFNTSNILPSSLPTLKYVADLLNENWQIAHLVIEGHASEEGSYVYNYDLSIRRSRAIWEELIRAGAHPDRMSYRGMGETVPRNAGDDEASLAGNRRVEFKIVRQYRPDEEPEQLREEVKLPWSGEPADVGVPPKPEAPPEPPPKDPADLDLDDFFDEEEEAARDVPNSAPAPAPADDTEPPAEGATPEPAPSEDAEPPAEDAAPEESP